MSYKRISVRFNMDVDAERKAWETIHEKGNGLVGKEIAFTAYCVSYVLCSRYNVPKDMFRFDRLPEGFSTMDARSVRNELSKIRDVANEISSDMAKVLDKSMKPKERRDEAR